MAKDVKKLPKKQDLTLLQKAKNVITYLPKRMVRAIRNTIAELKKVTWPTRKDLINYTTIVIIFMVLMAIIVGVLDLGASEVIALILRV